MLNRCKHFLPEYLRSQYFITVLISDFLFWKEMQWMQEKKEPANQQLFRWFSQGSFSDAVKNNLFFRSGWQPAKNF